MKAIVEIGEIGAKVEVDSGEAIVSHQKDFAVSMKEVEHPQINEISVFPGTYGLRSNGRMVG